MKRFLIATLVLALTGCASKQLAVNDAKGVPYNRVMKPALLQEKPGTVGIVFIREDAAIQGVLGSLNVWVNGEPLASLHAGEAVRLWMSPDLHVFSLTTMTRGSEQFRPSELKYGEKKVEVDAKLTRSYEVRIDLTTAGLMADVTSAEARK
ncbi:hypothetical protein DBR37_05745 [Herminiimonas sp. KBW02]|uniref:DUF2846 domain-containing protein n=1 Tax=Herminiimonas contaminans TaxID=1111140 RepID=A0ABS0ESU2_9BURK|nr:MULTISPECIES: hypothetical protein [Herminiimonas]MBF8176927.1 hypothetical protein [Herminiimonas contaminans]RQO35861.1 hypothetical protein DBR37_05745 [Herminiimonas sp. KBW02]